MLLHVMVLSLVFSNLVHAPCLGCATAMVRHLLSSKWWISSEIILHLFFVVSFDHHHCGWRPSPALPIATEPITSLILREDSAVSTAYLSFHFRPVIMAGCTLFTDQFWCASLCGHQAMMICAYFYVKVLKYFLLKRNELLYWWYYLELYWQSHNKSSQP